MPVAYSNLPIVKGTMRADTAAHMVADLDGLVTLAGWTVKTAVTGGFRYTLTSPQGFQCKVLVQDDVNYHADWPAVVLYPSDFGLVVQFMNFDETVKGFPHQLIPSRLGPRYTGPMQVIVGICQLFISVPGSTITWGSVAGGIPSRPNDTGPCNAGLGTVTVTDIWWSCGGSQFAFDFRISANCYACSTYYLNGVAVIAADNNNVRPYDGLLCLFPLAPVDTYTIPVQYPAITYSAHTPLCSDAFIGWGWTIKGQLWDAFLQTNAQTLDSVGSFSDTDTDGNTVLISAQCWYSDFYSSLRLIYGNPTADIGPGNVAF